MAEQTTHLMSQETRGRGGDLGPLQWWGSPSLQAPSPKGPHTSHQCSPGPQAINTVLPPLFGGDFIHTIAVVPNQENSSVPLNAF